MSHDQPDPRFDPRFQRGYRAQDAAAEAATASPTERTTVPTAGRPVSIETPPWSTRSREVATGPVRVADAPEAEADADAVATADARTTPPARMGPNPFVIAIFVVSALLLAAGGGLIWYRAMVAFDYGTTDEWAYAIETVTSLLPNALVSGGLVGLALGGATLAVLGRRRPR